MADIFFDTNFLAEFLRQYFTSFRERKEFSVTQLFSSNLVKRLNKIVLDFESNETFIIGASSFAFLEIARQFKIIVNEDFTIEQFRAFISQPPGWFLIASIDDALFDPLLSIPPVVVIRENLENIEWADAIHYATILSRDKAYLATSDHRLKLIPGFYEVL